MVALEIRRSVLDETEAPQKPDKSIDAERKSTLMRDATVIVTPGSAIFAGWGPRALL